MDSESDSNANANSNVIKEETKKLNEKNSENENIEIKQERNACQICKQIVFWSLKYFVSLLLGFFFGYAMEKAKVYEPIAIRQQMIFRRFIMLKMFLAALATSTFSIFLVAIVFKKRYENVLQSGKKALETKPMLTLISGGILIGVGMQISGSCPGMVLVQLGAGVPWSYITFIGGLCGALFHGLVEKWLKRTDFSKSSIIMSKTLFEPTRIPAFIIRLILIMLLGLTVFLMEFFIPWTKEYSNPIAQQDSSNIFIYKAWPPYICGILLGSLQLVSLVALEKSLGASSFYSSCAALPFCTKYLKTKFTYLARFRAGLQNWLALAFTVGSVLGAFISAYPSGVWGLALGVHPYNAFLGGFIMIVGARIAGGCTSGHGISGCSHQLIGSFITTAAMFGGAIILAFYALTNDFFFS